MSVRNRRFWRWSWATGTFGYISLWNFYSVLTFSAPPFCPYILHIVLFMSCSYLPPLHPPSAHCRVCVCVIWGGGLGPQSNAITPSIKWHIVASLGFCQRSQQDLFIKLCCLPTPSLPLTAQLISPAQAIFPFFQISHSGPDHDWEDHTRLMFAVMPWPMNRRGGKHWEELVDSNREIGGSIPGPLESTRRSVLGRSITLGAWVCVNG